MTRTKLARAVAVLALLLATGCMKRQTNPAQLPADELFQRASVAYEERNFGRATQLLDVFVRQHHGDPRAPEARLMLGRAHMARKDFVTAATHFQQLINDFPTSQLGLPARFGICEAYFRLSPRPALDQEYTRSAMLHCESIATYYPGTEEAQKGTQYVAELREKLARKVFQTGEFYVKRRAYDAAVVYFNEVLELYPQTSLAPAALAQLVETYTTLGYVEEADQARERLLREYPNSPEAQALRT